MNEHKPAQLNIKNAEAYDLATEIAEMTRRQPYDGSTARLCVRRRPRSRREHDREDDSLRCSTHRSRAIARYRTVTRGPPDEILGYDENGLPT